MRWVRGKQVRKVQQLLGSSLDGGRDTSFVKGDWLPAYCKRHEILYSAYILSEDAVQRTAAEYAELGALKTPLGTLLVRSIKIAVAKNGSIKMRVVRLHFNTIPRDTYPTIKPVNPLLSADLQIAARQTQLSTAQHSTAKHRECDARNIWVFDHNISFEF